MPPELLPKWFRVMKRIASQLFVGFSLAYGLVTRVIEIEPKTKEIVKMVIVFGWLPSTVLAGANAIDYIKYVKRDS